MCVCSATQMCLTLCYLMDCSLPGSSVHGLLQVRILEWVAISSPKGIFLIQGLNLCLPLLLHCQGNSLLLTWEDHAPTSSSQNPEHCQDSQESHSSSVFPSTLSFRRDLFSSKFLVSFVHAL